MQLQSKPEQAAKNYMENRFLIFMVKDQFYGIEITNVLEIIEMLPITKVPGIPECIKGIVNIRGMIVSIIDIRLRFGYEEIAYNERTCVVVVDNGGVSVGLIVDQVLGVINISLEEISPPPDKGLSKKETYLRGIGRANNETQLLLDCDKLLDIGM